MGKQRHEVAVIGAYATPVTKKPVASIRQVFADTAIKTLQDAGVKRSEVDGLITTPPGINPDIVIMYGAFLGKYLGIKSKVLEVVENGGTTSALALRCAASEVALGRVKKCLVLSADQRAELINYNELEQTIRFGAKANIGLQGVYDGAYGAGFPVPFYAMGGQRYMHEYGVTKEDIANVVVQLRKHAVRHPGAQFNEMATMEEILDSPMQSPPLTLHMCCPVSSAGAGVLVTTVEEAEKMGKPYVKIAGIGGYHEPEHFLPVDLDRDFTTYRSAIEASNQAYEEAGITADDIDIAEVYGVFAPTELMLYEDLGFVKQKGQAAKAVAEGKLTFGGDVVVNPTGGRICYGHPAAATPLLETVEVVEQLRGTAGDRQVENARWGLTHAEHGCLNGSVVMTYEGIR